MADLLMVDAWAWVALYNPKDQYHAVAVLANEELIDAGFKWVTTNFVLDETYTGLRRWGSPTRAITFGQTIQKVVDTGALEIITITPDIEKTAWKLFSQYDSIAGLSYTDCTTFAAMQIKKIHHVFTVDEHFRIAGFILHP